MPQEKSPLFTSVTTEEFARKKIVGKEITEVIFDTQTFIEGPTFSKSNRQIAIDYCQQQAQKKRHTLLVCSQLFFAVWLQKLPLEESINSQIPSSNWFENNLPAAVKASSTAKNDLQVVYVNRQESELSYVNKVKGKVKIPDKSDTAIRKYRGISYEVGNKLSQEPVIQDAVEVTQEKASQNFKKITVVQKYRGVSYTVEKGKSKHLVNPTRNSIPKSPRKYRGQSY